MVKGFNLIKKEKLSDINSKIKELDYKTLSRKEKMKILEAKKEFLEGNSLSFEEVYKECMN